MEELKEKLKNVKEKYAHWNGEGVGAYLSSSCGDCSDIGSQCHGDGECGGDGE